MKTFTELNLIEPLQRAIAGENYKIPTPIQSKTIPVALKRRDVLGCAQTGTGKTAAFALPILNRLGLQNRAAKAKRPFALILAPTRELAVQIGASVASRGFAEASRALLRAARAPQRISAISPVYLPSTQAERSGLGRASRDAYTYDHVTPIHMITWPL